MENQEQEIYASREHKQSHYDKRLIMKIVKEVEEGLPRKEANPIKTYSLYLFHRSSKKSIPTSFTGSNS